jgi:hypothetical protein
VFVYPTTTLGALGNSPPILIGNNVIGYGQLDIDQARSITSLGLICTLSAGANLTYSVQVSADPPTEPIVDWNNHDVLVSQTASANSNVAYPITALRLAVTSYTSGSVTLGVAQWP